MGNGPTSSDPEPPPAPQPRRVPAEVDQPGPGVQFMLLGWCLWLLGEWLVALWIDAAEPAARWMVFASVSGLMLVWPAARLAQWRPVDRWVRAGSKSAPERAGLILLLTFLEWVCLVLVFQAVIWPLGLVAGWAMAQTFWLDAAVLSWSLMTAALIGGGCSSSRSGPRTVAMAACAALLLAEPVAMALWQAMHAGEGRSVGWTMCISPIQTIWSLSHDHARLEIGPWRICVVTAGVAAGAAWALLIGMARLGERKSPSGRGEDRPPRGSW